MSASHGSIVAAPTPRCTRAAGTWPVSDTVDPRARVVRVGVSAAARTGVRMAVRFFRSKAAPHPDDSLQISGAIVAPSDGPSPVQLVDAGHAPHGLGVVRDQYERKIRKTPTIRMVPSSMMVEGRRLRFAVSDNVDAHGPDGPGHPLWAVNIHGYFAGGGMYWRRAPASPSSWAGAVINPSLPGFGGSDPLDWQDVSMESLANQVMAIVHKVDAGPVGPPRPLHGRCGRRAVRPRPPAAHARRDLPRRREHPRLEGAPGCSRRCSRRSSPTWPRWSTWSPPSSSTSPTSSSAACTPPCAPCCPTCARTSAPCPRRMPVGSMLMGVDQRSEVRHLAAQQIPILNEWGCFDRITPGHTALEFAAIARSPGPVGARRPQLDAGPAPGPGGHPHPSRPGREFIARWRPLAPAHPARVHAARRQLTSREGGRHRARPRRAGGAP